MLLLEYLGLVVLQLLLFGFAKRIVGVEMMTLIIIVLSLADVIKQVIIKTVEP